MCGIVGVIVKGKNGFFNSEVKAFSQMLLVGQVRGVDGTGVFFNAKKNEPVIHRLRAAIDSNAFVNSKQYGEVESTLFTESNFIIGHNRAATKGSLDDKSTHPFREKHITLVHNGTLHSQAELHATAEVDSHAICHSIANIGHVETLKKINGAFALIWFNAVDRTLNMVRNTQRPLSIVEFTSCFLVCSEPDMAIWIGGRCGLKHVKTTELTPKKLVTFNLEDMSTFSEVEVEFKTFQAETKTQSSCGYEYYNKYFPKETKETTKVGNIKLIDYSYGNVVKVRTGKVRTTALGSCIEVDFLRNQHTQKPYFAIDFEDEFRGTIWGTPEELKAFECSDYVEARVSHILISNGYTTYTLTKPKNHLQTFALKPTLEVKQDVCDWCGAVHPRTDLVPMQGYDVCPTCAAPINGGC